MIGTTPRTYFRLGYGFSRQRNGAVNMHAALCVPAVTGAWRHEGGGRLSQQRRDLPLGPVAHRGAGCPGPGGPRARPVSNRARAHRRSARPGRRPAGDRDAHPEHEPDDGRAGAPPGPRGLRPQGPLRLRARAVHDRDGGDRGHRAAGDDVRRARRHLPGGRTPAHPFRTKDNRAARRVPAKPPRSSANSRDGWAPNIRGSR